MCNTPEKKFVFFTGCKPLETEVRRNIGICGSMHTAILAVEFLRVYVCKPRNIDQDRIRYADCGLHYKIYCTGELQGDHQILMVHVFRAFVAGRGEAWA
jgi:hypothetical protein